MPANRTRALLPPVDPQRFVPTRERPVRAKSRHLEQDTEIAPHSHAWAQVVVCASGVARITAGHSTYLVPAWRAVWIPPHIEHLVSVVEAAELRTLYVHQEAGHVGPGVSREAAAACVQLAFDIGAVRIHVITDTRNIRSIKFAEALGMQHEGVLRNYEQLDGVVCDQALLSIIRSRLTSSTPS